MEAYPAIVFRLGGKSRRLSAARQWRTAITEGHLERDTIVTLETDPDNTVEYRAGVCPQLVDLFDEILGPAPRQSQTPGGDPSPTKQMDDRAEPETDLPTVANPLSATGDGLVNKRAELTSLVATQMRPKRTPSPIRAPRSAATPSSPIDWMVLPLKRYVDFQGRSNRAEYWWFILGSNLAALFLVAIAGGIGSDALLGMFSLAICALIPPTLAVTVRRLHDLNLSGWWLCLYALALVPVVNIVICVAAVVAMATRGTQGPNRFGNEPGR